MEMDIDNRELDNLAQLDGLAVQLGASALAQAANDPSATSSHTSTASGRTSTTSAFAVALGPSGLHQPHHRRRRQVGNHSGRRC
jgi:hypothetical protein